MNEKNEKNNARQLKQFSQTLKDNENFEWDEKYIYELLKGEIPEQRINRRELQYDHEYKKVSSLLLELISKFNNKNISIEEYYDKEKETINEINGILNDETKNKEKVNIHNYYDQNSIREIVDFSKKILIKGDGGVGKSFLLYKFIEKLKESKIQFICSFGKYDKEFNQIDLENILEVAKDTYIYFIIDALNEYDDNGLKKIEEFIENNHNNKNIRFILSYRKYAISEDKLKKIKDIFEREYELFGINLDNIITIFIEKYGIDITKYENIINIQSPFYIKILKKCMEDKKIKKEILNGESQVTFIYEQFIKAVDYSLWNPTKNIVAKYLYEQEKKTISLKEFKSIMPDSYSDYINKMQEAGLLISYVKDSEELYYFTIDSLNDFIVGRTFLDEIGGLKDEQIIEIINKKLEKLYSLYTVFIICLFDRFQKDIKRVVNIIKKSNIRDIFDLSILRMIRFENQNIIDEFQKEWDVNEEDAFNNITGYHNKPFNFTNYFNKILINKDKNLNLLSMIYNLEHFKQKAKNIATITKAIEYNADIFNETSFREYFWFSFWLSGSSNKELSDICKKNIYEICSKCNNYYNTIIKMYRVIKDDYIKNAIVEIICTSSSNVIKKYEPFLKSIYFDNNEINSLRIVRIDNAIFGGERKYININKIDLLKEVKDTEIEDWYDEILFKAELYDKYLLPWRYDGKERIHSNLNFIENSKIELTKITEYLTNKYPCLLDERIYCNYTKGALLEENNFSIDEIKIDTKKYLILYKNILMNLLEEYDIKIETFVESLNYSSFFDSNIYKFLNIAQQRLIGTLMCNYYTNEFCMNKNNYENKVGYSVYNPYQYDDSFELNYVHPYSKFNELADSIDQKLKDKIEQSSEKGKDWENDVKGIKENLLKLIEPIEINNDKWIVLSASLRYSSKEKYRIEWLDTYLINSTFDSEKKLTGVDDRYLTIEQKEYNESILDYTEQNFEECTIMKPIKNSTSYFPDNYLILPPTNLINKLALHYSPNDSSWVTSKNEVVMISNNNDKIVFKDVVSNTLYIKEKFLNGIKEKINYFSFTSRSKGEGYSEESEFHMQFNSIQGEIASINNKNQKSKDVMRCSQCKYDKVQTEEDIEKTLKEYEALIEKL